MMNLDWNKVRTLEGAKYFNLLDHRPLDLFTYEQWIEIDDIMYSCARTSLRYSDKVFLDYGPFDPRALLAYQNPVPIVHKEFAVTDKFQSGDIWMYIRLATKKVIAAVLNLGRQSQETYGTDTHYRDFPILDANLKYRLRLIALVSSRTPELELSVMGLPIPIIHEVSDAQGNESRSVVPEAPQAGQIEGVGGEDRPVGNGQVAPNGTQA